MRFTAGLALLLLMAGCGGGGGGGPDPANPVAPPTTGALHVSDGSARASFAHQAVAFNAAGRGVAVWEAQAGITTRLLWAFFDGSTWSAETELASAANRPAVATNGTDFMLIWISSRVVAATCSESGVLGTPAPISDWSVSDPDLASNGSGYAATWSGYDTVSGETRIFAGVYSASAWGAWQVVEPAAGSENVPRIASDGTAYAVCFRKESGGAYDVRAALSSDGSSAATWSASTLLETGAGDTAHPRIASDEGGGGGYAVVWAQEGGGTWHAYANVRSAGAWAPAGTLLSADPLQADETAIASNGSGYAAAWSEGAGARVHARIDDGGGWAAAEILDDGAGPTGRPSLASDGAGYAAVWAQDDGVGGSDVQASVTASGAWSAPEPLDAGAGPAGDPLVAPHPAGYAASFFQDDPFGDPDLFVVIRSGGSWGAPTPLVEGTWKGAALHPRMATNREGVSLAVWAERHGGTWRAVASLNATGTWGAPFVLDENSSHQVAVATNGTSFMTLWYSNTQYALLGAVCSEAGALGVPQPLGPVMGNPAYDPALASNGSGYAAVWTAYDGGWLNAYANVYAGGSWATDGGGDPAPWLLETLDGYAYAPGLASNGTGYAAVWVQQVGGISSAFASVFTSGDWPADGTALESADLDVHTVSVASTRRRGTSRTGWATTCTRGSTPPGPGRVGTRWSRPGRRAPTRP